MTYYILQSNGEIVARSTVSNITNLEAQTDAHMAIVKEYDGEISRRIKADEFPVDGDKSGPELWADLKNVDEDFREEFFKVYQNEDLPEAMDDVVQPSPGIADSEILSMELAIPRDGANPELARVKRRKKDSDGNPIGTANKNPVLDTRVFEVEFGDGHTAAMTANVIAENLFSQVDQDGYRLLLMDEIMDHRGGSDAMMAEDAFVQMASDERNRRLKAGSC